MASICVHRAPPTPSDIAPGHIGSRDDFQEFGRPATHGRQGPVSAQPSALLQFIWRPNRPSRALQGTSVRAMFCRKIADLPHTALRAWSHTFLQFIWQGNRHSTGLQGTFARAMASICAHRAPRTPPGIAPGHIRSRDGLQEARGMKNPDLTYMAAKGPTPAFLQSFRALCLTFFSVKFLCIVLAPCVTLIRNGISNTYFIELRTMSLNREEWICLARLIVFLPRYPPSPNEIAPLLTKFFIFSVGIYEFVLQNQIFCLSLQS